MQPNVLDIKDHMRMCLLPHYVDRTRVEQNWDQGRLRRNRVRIQNKCRMLVSGSPCVYDASAAPDRSWLLSRSQVRGGRSG